MNDKKLLELKKELENLNNAAERINELWNDYETNQILQDDYPFEKDYYEMTLKIRDWKDTSIKKLERRILK